jgi:hypothetical protein
MEFEKFLELHNNKPSTKEELVEALWGLQLTITEKINLTFRLFDLYPSYHVLTAMWRQYSSSGKIESDLTEIIFKKYLERLSDTSKDLSDSMEYSLYFDILEDPDRNDKAWKFFVSNSPNNTFLKILLNNSGPVPYLLKHDLYLQLVNNSDFHTHIYYSIRHSCFDNCGHVDKIKASEILTQLKLDDKIEEINSHPGFRKFAEVKEFLSP